MGLAEVQTALARLYTDRSARQLLQENEHGFAQSAGLSLAEVSQLRSMTQEIEEFARSLIAKRLGEVRKRLPVSSRVLAGKDFASLFHRYANGEASECSASAKVAPGRDPHRDDAVQFVTFLIQHGLQLPTAPAWTIDLLRYESAWLLMADPRRRCLVQRFQFPMQSLVRRLTTDLSTYDFRSRTSLCLWWRYRYDGRTRHVCWE